MLKIRVVPTLLYKDFGLVKGVAFDSWRQVGSAMQAVKVYNMRGVDELVFVDVAATPEGRRPDTDLIDDLADECFMPLTVGGGVRAVEDFHALLDVGADKVAVGTAALEDPGLVRKASERFGSQCVVVSIDTRGPSVWTHCGTVDTGRDPVEVARDMEDLGAGELLVTSIERDGTMQGYDLETIRRVTHAVSIPVIVSGGAGTYGHMVDAVVEGGASAVAAASTFHFTQQTPMEAKQHLRAAGLPVRE